MEVGAKPFWSAFPDQSPDPLPYGCTVAMAPVRIRGTRGSMGVPLQHLMVGSTSRWRRWRSSIIGSEDWLPGDRKSVPTKWNC